MHDKFLFLIKYSMNAVALLTASSGLVPEYARRMRRNVRRPCSHPPHPVSPCIAALLLGTSCPCPKCPECSSSSGYVLVRFQFSRIVESTAKLLCQNDVDERRLENRRLPRCIRSSDDHILLELDGVFHWRRIFQASVIIIFDSRLLSDRR